VGAVHVLIEDLQLLGVEAGFLQQLGGAEPGLEAVAGVQVPHPDLDECPEVAGGPVLELHDTAGIAFVNDDGAPPDIACLHDPLFGSVNRTENGPKMR
jgi:hypothetical protein